ncbi:ELMO domain-containing protein 3 [Dryobates pubescens]|uniref:ELMO domain-containing protein 3 n=1 Tax=Dryobates pubescens TaxID=118200 RepID=UPI0023B8BD5E|nr:ELMO domain-containing protein 3 [Dryobates pubescens]
MSGGAGGLERPEERQREPPPGKSLPVPALGQNELLKALVEGAEPPVGAEGSEELRRAQEEWEAVEEAQSGPGGLAAGRASLISFNEALQHFQSAQLRRRRVRAQVPVPRPGLASLLRFLFGPPRLQPQLQGEQELALAMAQCALDDEQKVHMRILQTVYRRLTCSRLGCPRYGAHWEELGFQGVDPGTDLRGTGMLGLMQILFFVMDPQLLPLAREIFRLSQHQSQSFPFCIMSVNITRMVLQALREERLSRECNRRQQVLAVLNQLYAAAFLRLYCLWRGQHRTLADSSALLKELELATKKKPKQLLKSLEAFLKQSPTAEALQQLPSPAGPGGDIDFVGICEPQVELEGAARLL